LRFLIALLLFFPFCEIDTVIKVISYAYIF